MGHFFSSTRTFALRPQPSHPTLCYNLWPSCRHQWLFPKPASPAVSWSQLMALGSSQLGSSLTVLLSYVICNLPQKFYLPYFQRLLRFQNNIPMIGFHNISDASTQLWTAIFPGPSYCNSFLAGLLAFLLQFLPTWDAGMIWLKSSLNHYSGSLHIF